MRKRVPRYESPPFLFGPKSSGSHEIMGQTRVRAGEHHEIAVSGGLRQTQTKIYEQKKDIYICIPLYVMIYK